MLSNPTIGTRVTIHYAKKWLNVPCISTRHLQDREGVVVVRATGKKCKNHGVLVDGVVYAIPAGNLRKMAEGT